MFGGQPTFRPRNNMVEMYVGVQDRLTTAIADLVIFALTPERERSRNSTANVAELLALD